MNYVIVSLVFIAATASLSSGMAKARRISPELARKVVHVSLGLSIFGVSLLTNRTWTAVLISVSFSAIIIARETQRFDILRQIGRKSHGDMFFLLGAFAALLIAKTQAAFGIGILILALADSLAAIVGMSVGRHRLKLLGETKTLEGSLAFLLISTAIVLAYVLTGPSYIQGRYILAAVLPLSLVVTEALSPRGLDNLTIPVVATLLVNTL